MHAPPPSDIRRRGGCNCQPPAHAWSVTVGLDSESSGASSCFSISTTPPFHVRSTTSMSMAPACCFALPSATGVGSARRRSLPDCQGPALPRPLQACRCERAHKIVYPTTTGRLCSCRRRRMRASSAPAVGGSRVGRAPGVCEVCPVAACALGGRWHGVGAEAEAVRPGRGAGGEGRREEGAGDDKRKRRKE